MANHYLELTGHLQEPAFLYDALYCSEETFGKEEEQVKENCLHEGRDGGESDCCSYEHSLNSPLRPTLPGQDTFWEDEQEQLSYLFSKEERNHLHKILETDSSLAESRREAVDWILKVSVHYSFTALTAVLAVNYLDRFLVSFHFQTEKPWTTQLASVACLSIAAKVEEIQVPLLLDFQVEDSKFVFEAKTIQRMEILVLSTLGWRMNPVTPLSFLDYMTRRLGLKGYLRWEFHRRCELILLSVISDSRSTSYEPSVMATATMLHVINGVKPYLGSEHQSQLLGILGNQTNKDKVEDCRKLMAEVASRHRGEKQSTKRKLNSIPGSPNGVMEMSFSSDSSNDSWSAASSVTSSPESLPKKSRSLESLSHATADFLGISR